MITHFIVLMIFDFMKVIAKSTVEFILLVNLFYNIWWSYCEDILLCSLHTPALDISDME